jgi:hypothetical protein
VRAFTAIAKPEAFVRVVSRMTSAELVRLGEEMARTGLTGREVVGRAAADAGQWEHLILEPL